MFMAIGDLHLGCLSSYMPKLYKKQLVSLKRVLDYAVEHDIGHVIMAGDLFDNPYPPNYLVIALRRLLSQYADDLFFHIIIGNHDWESIEHHSLQIFHDLGRTGKFNFKVYRKPTTITIEGVRMFMCPHPYILDVPTKKIDWCIGHFAWNNAKTDNGRMVASGNAPRGRWILGDFHPHQHGNRYVYCGSLTQILWHELLPKGIVLFDKDDWQFKPFEPAYKLGVADVASDEDLRKLDGDTLWSVRNINNYSIPADIKQQMHNIVHMTVAKRRKDLRAAVLLAKDDNVLHNPMRILKDYLQGHKLDLSKWELQAALKTGKRLYDELVR